VGYEYEESRQPAMIFKVDKDDIRAILASPEARTGRKVEFQDDDARGGGKGRSMVLVLRLLLMFTSLDRPKSNDLTPEEEAAQQLAKVRRT